ncbi:MAG TPA: MerR family transcriptional regulator [Xanthobacteraceae bacterium]
MEKAPDAFRTISEVAGEIDVPQHVLRFWESRFSQIRPMKRGGGRRYYRPDDVDLLRGVRHLLYGEGYTIRGVQRILREEGTAFVQNVWRTSAAPPPEALEDAAEAGAIGETADSVPSPDLTVFNLPPAQNRAGEAAVSEQQQPTIAVPTSVAAPRHGVASEDTQRLRSVLDELVECRRLIEAALSDNDLGDEVAGDGEP